MKKRIFLPALMIFVFGVAQAQVKTEVEKVRTNTKVKLAPSKTPAPPPPPAPAPVSKSTATPEVLVYKLTSARVRIRTGNDNKEFQSKVLVSLKTKNTSNAVWSPFGQQALDNEMRINSDTEFGLERYAQSTAPVDLATIQAEGLKLIMTYLPNWLTDAWKIESVTLILEFKDQHGNLHPTMGNKTIVFSNAYGFLNNDYRDIECITDGNLAPLTAVIKK